ncbi:hypothetical protein D0962_21645 [Leptolyngbyaceae cyanobacterium CCMR0082]|uniref:HTH araC/xylS-type domain-containing protein n=1 Tax=Adonisia turfae CCMR0082 TaxID=2304604 RepID=A0A6M0SA21_9CYAN|nr:hypothetical protein [Adonisia turfae CCMR0082]
MRGKRRQEDTERGGGFNKSRLRQSFPLVGYAHLGKFAATFKKKFSINPKALKSTSLEDLEV